MKNIYFNKQSERAQRVKGELIAIMQQLQDVTLRLHKVSFDVPLEDVRGRLQGYADTIDATSGNISELFEFYN